MMHWFGDGADRNTLFRLSRLSRRMGGEPTHSMNTSGHATTSYHRKFQVNSFLLNRFENESVGLSNKRKMHKTGQSSNLQ